MANDYKGVSGIYMLKFYEDLSSLSTAQTITPAGGYTDQDCSTPFAGSIVGIAAEHSELSTYDMVLTVQVGGAASATITIDKAEDGDGQASFMPGTWPVDVDDDIQVKASWATGSSAYDGGETSVWVFVQVGSSGT